MDDIDSTFEVLTADLRDLDRPEQLYLQLLRLHLPPLLVFLAGLVGLLLLIVHIALAAAGWLLMLFAIWWGVRRQRRQRSHLTQFPADDVT